jgi:nucleotide-binding universal stress UspA family protein
MSPNGFGACRQIARLALGTHEHHRATEILSERVAHDASCSVLVARTALQPQERPC